MMFFVISGRAEAVLHALAGAIAAPSGAIPTYNDPSIQSGGGFGGGQTTGTPPPPQQPPFSTGPDALRVDTGPTISATQIDDILAQYHSPAAGLGQTFYSEGVAHGINPAVALAFFIHESQAGTDGVARFTRSIGNIRATGNEPAYQGFKQYSSWAAGITDYYRLIKDVYITQWGLNTVDTIIPRYAPTSDGNNPARYIQAVKDLIRSWHWGQGA